MEPPTKKAKQDEPVVVEEEAMGGFNEGEEEEEDDLFERMKDMTVMAASLKKGQTKPVTMSDVMAEYSAKNASIREIVIHDHEESGTQMTVGFVITKNKETFVLSADFMRGVNRYEDFGSVGTV